MKSELILYTSGPRMNHSTNAVTLPPPVIASSCSGCSTYVIDGLETFWNTTATVIVEVDKASNKTRTSTVQGTSILPSAPLGGSYVTGSVITTVVGEGKYTMYFLHDSICAGIIHADIVEHFSHIPLRPRSRLVHRQVRGYQQLGIRHLYILYDRTRPSSFRPPTSQHPKRTAVQPRTQALQRVKIFHP